MRNYKISVFLPVYNLESAQLANNVKTILSFLKKNYRKFEIIIINDTSNEETTEAINSATKLGNVTAIHYYNGPSRRENLAASFQKANFNTICFMDIDLSTEISSLVKLTDKIYEGYDIAIGSRHKGVRAKREAYRKIISTAYNLFLSLMFGSKILDHNCGFKAFKKNSILKLVKKMGYDKSFSRGWFWDAEMIILAQKINFKIAEIAVAWKRDEQTTFSLSREIKIIPYMIMFWLLYLYRKLK